MKCDICRINFAEGTIAMHCVPKGKVCFGCVRELVNKELNKK